MQLQDEEVDIKLQFAKAQNQALVVEMHKFKRKIAELEVGGLPISQLPESD
jgi:hypothetical protein